MCAPSLAIWRKLRRYRAKSTGKSFSSPTSILQYAWKFFPRLFFPAWLEITALAFIWVVIPQTLQFSKLGLTCFFGVVTSFADIFPWSMLEWFSGQFLDFAVKQTCWRNVRYDWFSASMRRQMILDPSLPGVVWQERGSRTGLPPKWWFHYVDDSHSCFKKYQVNKFHKHLYSSLWN